MTSISLADPANHTLADATLVASNNALIEGVINGNIDNGNIVAAAAIAITKLAAGANGQILKMVGAVPTWVSPGTLFAEVATDETTTSGSYVDLATSGPSVTVPTSGDWLISFGVTALNASGGSQNLNAAVKLGAAATADAESINCDMSSSGGVLYASPARTIKRSLTASDVVKLQYKVSGGATAHFLRRWVRLEAA